MFAVLCTGSAGGAGAAQAAGLFDAIAGIFGAGPQPPVDRQAPARTHFRYEDLEPVSPGPRVRRERARPEGRERRVLPAAIDPAKVPDWFLRDETLRRGDIVVLTDGVFVFEGGRAPHDPRSFVPLERSRLSAGEQARLAAMKGYRPSGGRPPVAPTVETATTPSGPGPNNAAGTAAIVPASVNR